MQSSNETSKDEEDILLRKVDFSKLLMGIDNYQDSERIKSFMKQTLITSWSVALIKLIEASFSEGEQGNLQSFSQ